MIQNITQTPRQRYLKINSFRQDIFKMRQNHILFWIWSKMFGSCLSLTDGKMSLWRMSKHIKTSSIHEIVFACRKYLQSPHARTAYTSISLVNLFVYLFSKTALWATTKHPNVYSMIVFLKKDNLREF